VKYKIDYTHSNGFTIHLQKRLTKKSYQSLFRPSEKLKILEECNYSSEEDFYDHEIETDPTPLYIKRIWCIDGIKSIYIDQYSIQIEKGSAFEWDAIPERVISILNLELFPFDSVPEKIVKIPETDASNTPIQKKDPIGYILKRLRKIMHINEP